MSDFDKEAEREKLREKYERDAEKRRATEQMSELLLKGATMTNAHCSDCGDPIFRYDGQEFCPTCQKPVDRGDGGAGADAGGADAGQADESAADGPSASQRANGGDNIEVASPSDDARVQFGDQGAPDDADDGASADADPANGTPADSRPGSAARDAPEPQSPERTPADDRSGAQPPEADVGDATAGEHLGRAQVSLAQTVERFARRAREAESPREAREHLEAARAAAEALEATSF